MNPAGGSSSFRDVRWRISYRTSSVGPDGKAVDILRDFYLPVLSRAAVYDRVAGYFRSSSLAAASQGLSSLVGRAGRIRMIVGADLDPQDVGAVLAGSEQRLADCLSDRLGQPQQWDPATMNGVQLLSWLVAHDNLEIRVAFRVHAQTGEPLAADATSDGYVHEKWAVFEDPGQNRIYISGSLNESKTALALNAENIDVHCEWDNERDAQRVSEAVADFQALWENKNPGVKVMPLPEAVRQKLISFSRGLRQPREIDGSTMAPVFVAPPSWRERLKFMLIRDGARLPGGLFYGLETAPIQPWPHQDVVARRLVESFPCSFLLSDEVGLGKTIEAGLAIRSLYMSGIAQRILVAAPASLTKQWHREMATKFALPFHRLLRGTPARHALLLPEERETAGREAFQPDLLIVSTGLLARDDRQKEVLKAPPFDLCLLDEAHYARRQGSGNQDPYRAHPRFGRLYRAFRDVLRDRSRSLWLATATPMQMHTVEVADLLGLTGRVGPFQFEPALMQEYYDLLGRLLRQEGLETDHWEFLRQVVLGVRQQDPRLWGFLADSAIDAAVRAILRRWIDLGHPPSASNDRRATLRLLFTLAPLSRVMLRHTRRLLEIYRREGFLQKNLARRTIMPIPPITFTEQEKLVYDGLEAYCKELAARISANAQQRVVTSLGFYLSFLRLRFASSLFAIRATLERRREKVAATLASFDAAPPMEEDEVLEEESLNEDDEGDSEVDRVLKDRSSEDLQWELEAVDGLLSMLNDLTGPSSKMTELMKVIERRRSTGGRIQQMVVFTRFYDTLTDIVDRLLRVAPDLRLGTYSGQGGAWLKPGSTALEAADREQIRHRFLREEIDILVCTDAAAEGLNLQTADLLVNFDLPWNPMKVEQRIGRIDRIGQKYEEIFVLNLCYPDSAEQIVYGRLLQRLASAQLIVGMQQLSLLPVEADEFRLLAEGSLSPEELERRAMERARQTSARVAAMEIPPEDMFRMYQRLHEERRAVRSPVTLSDIWFALKDSPHLADRGCHPCPVAPEVLVLKNIPGIPDGTGLTVSRETYERGVSSLEGSLHFATPGDPVFEILLELFVQEPLPSGIARVESTRVVGAGRRVVGYLAAGKGGSPHCHQIVKYADLMYCEPEETGTITDEDRRNLQEVLDAQAAKEAEEFIGNARLDQANGLAARSQEIQNLLVGQSLLANRQSRDVEETLFWNVVRDLDAELQAEETVTVDGFAPDLAAGLVGVVVPFQGLQGAPFITAPSLLQRASLASVCRLANRLDVAKNELLTSYLLSRLEAEIQTRRKELSAFRTGGSPLR